MAWTEDRVEILTKMWRDGKSASEIAEELGGVTRNAVIGKVHRLGLSQRQVDEKKSEAKAESKKMAKKQTPSKKIDTKKSSEPIVEEIEDEDSSRTVLPGNDGISEEARKKAEEIESASKRLTLMQLTERSCKWPVGDPATEDFWFCGHPSQAGKPYCEAHVELAFQAPQARKR